MSSSAQVEIEPLKFKGKSNNILNGDLYRPPNPNGVGILLIHGGSFTQGDRKQLRGYGIQLGRLGYTCLACEYRLAPKNKWPAQLNDIHSALDRFHELASYLTVDQGKIVAWGNSAGGQLALMAAALQNQPIAAAVAFYTASDFLGAGARAHGSPETMKFLVGEDNVEEILSSMSPINYVRKDFPPTLLVTGNKDEVVDWQDSHAMYLRLSKEGAECELHIFDGAPHAFDSQTEYGRLCVSLGDLFISKHLESD